MKHVDFDPAALADDRKIEWDAWLARADKATETIVGIFERDGRVTADDFQPDIWSKLKAWLLKNVFDGKCAYCETHVKEARQPGHAEHFRPKAAIKNKIDVDGRSKLVVVRAKDPDGKEMDHPGYFWLAYNWENLVPSCNDCNTGRGKNNQFPVAGDAVLLRKVDGADLSKLRSEYVASVKWPQYYYLGPRDLDAQEQRLLLHPYFDDPCQHITFGVRGIEAACEVNGRPSPLGLHSIETYELDSDGLRRRRSRAQKLAFMQYMTGRQQAVMADKSRADAHRAGVQAVKALCGENPEFSAAIDAFIELQS